MKKLILTFAAFAIIVSVYAQPNKTYRQLDQRNINKIQNPNMDNHPVFTSIPDGVMMQDGKIMKLENGEMSILAQEITMSDGTTIYTDGNYTKSDGTKMMLKEGQHIDMDGNLTYIKEDQDKNMYQVPDSLRKKNL